MRDSKVFWDVETSAFNDDTDKAVKTVKRAFKWFGVLWVVSLLFSIAMTGFLSWAAIHFILKYW